MWQNKHYLKKLKNLQDNFLIKSTKLEFMLGSWFNKKKKSKALSPKKYKQGASQVFIILTHIVMYVLSGAGDCCQAGPATTRHPSLVFYAVKIPCSRAEETLAPWVTPGDGDSVTKLSLINGRGPFPGNTDKGRADRSFKIS